MRGTYSEGSRRVAREGVGWRHEGTGPEVAGVDTRLGIGEDTGPEVLECYQAGYGRGFVLSIIL